jgi:tetratricopeptide (TPR) repeat protein
MVFTITAGFILPVYADYNDDLQKGNDAYKAQNWSEASAYYRSAYAIKQDPTLKKFLDYSVSMAYKQDLAKGYAAYKASQTEEALKWYKEADALYPTKQVEDFIAKLGGSALPEANIQAAGTKQEQGSPVLKWGLVIADVSLAAYSVVAYMDQDKATNDYNNFYSQYNNTTVDNYNTLVSKLNDAQNKQNFFGTVAGITAGLVVYTLADAFIFHAIFTKDIALNIDYNRDRFAMAITKEF